MRAGRRYRHPHCLDVDLDIVKVTYVGPTYIKVRVRYWHRSLRAYLSFEPQTVKISRSDLPKWTEVFDAHG